MGIYLPSNATGLKHWKQAYLDPEYRWTTTNLEITSDRYSFTNVATMLGRTHIKAQETGEYLNLNALDIDCQQVLNRLSISIEQLLSDSSWDWVTPRLQELVRAFLQSAGVVNGDYSQSLLDILRKSTFVTKTRKAFGHHILWLSRQQRKAIGTAKCREGYEFEIKTDETLGLCTLPGSSHKEDLNFRYEAVGITDHLLANDIIYDLFVEMFKDCIVNGKLDDSSISNNSNNNSSNNSTSDRSSSNESSADFSAEDDKKKKEKELVFFDLSPGGIKASAGYLSDLVVQGHRHWFHNYLGGMMFYCQISFESASEVVSLLCDMTTDREKDSRLRSLELTYAKGKMGKALRGSTSLAGLIVNTVPSFREVENPSAAGKTIMDILKTIWQGDIKANVVTDPDEDKKLSQRVIESLRPAISLLFKDDSDTAFQRLT